MSIETRFNHYLSDPAQRPAPAGPAEPPRLTRGRVPGSGSRQKNPYRLMVAASLEPRLQALLERAGRTAGGVEGMTTQTNVIECAIREELAQLRADLGVDADQFPPSGRDKAPYTRRHSGVLRDTDTTGISIRFDNALLLEMNNALWYRLDRELDPEQFHGIATAHELATVALDRLLTRLGEPAAASG